MCPGDHIAIRIGERVCSHVLWRPLYTHRSIWWDHSGNYTGSKLEELLIEYWHSDEDCLQNCVPGVDIYFLYDEYGSADYIAAFRVNHLCDYCNRSRLEHRGPLESSTKNTASKVTKAALGH